MKILVDADACPVINIVEKEAKQRNLKVILLCDTNHILYSEYSEVKVIQAGTDAVDFALINICEKNDLVVTQDYGVAAMALGRGAKAIHQSGKWYTDENIDRMMMERYLAKEARRTSKNQFRGSRAFGNKQHKRTLEDNLHFQESFCKMLDQLSVDGRNQTDQIV